MNPVAVIALSWLASAIVTLILLISADRSHRADITRLHDSYARILDTKANVEQYGRATLPEAVTRDAEPQPEQRAEAAATEGMIRRGMESLRNVYKSIGVEATDEELRDEVLGVIADASGRPRFPSHIEASMAGAAE